MAENNNQPSWGATVGVYFGCLLTIGFVSGIVSMMGQNGLYTVGGLLSWLAALAPAGYYRSSGKAGAAFGIAIVIGAIIGAVALAIAPSIVQARYGSV